MATPAPMKLEHVIARAMAELRLERGWTQPDLARRMVEAGVAWTPNRVTQLETLRRPVSLFEVVALTWVFEVPVTRLLRGEQIVEAPDGKSLVPLANVRAALAGKAAAGSQEHRESRRRQQAFVDEVRKLAKKVELDEPRMFEWISRELYGRHFIDERESRLGDLSGLSATSARTKRGHATRALLDEIRKYLDQKGREQVTAEYAQYLAQRSKDVLRRVTELMDSGEVHDLAVFMKEGQMRRLDLRKEAQSDD